MIGIKKRIFIISMCLLLFFLTSCSETSNQSSKNVVSSTTSNKLPELKGQDLSDITKLAIPDELSYLHDGNYTIITKNNPKFQKIIALNTARQTNKLGACKCAIDYKSIEKNGDYLIYLYNDTNYVPVYFMLVPSPNGKFESWLINYYDKLPSERKVNRTNINAFGHLAPADELLAYLKS